MYDRPQIPDNLRADAAALEDFERRIRDCLCPCGKKFELEKSFFPHFNSCKEAKRLSLLVNKNNATILNGDLIDCKICGFIGKMLTGHIKKDHNLSKEE